MTRRIHSATWRARFKLQFCSSIPNSSPPKRAKVSPSYNFVFNNALSWRSNSSPALCPQLSLTNLNYQDPSNTVRERFDTALHLVKFHWHVVQIHYD